MVKYKRSAWALLVGFVISAVAVTIVIDASLIGFYRQLVVEFATLSLLAWYSFWAELKLSRPFPRSELKWILAWHLVTIPTIAFELAGIMLGVYASLCLGVFGSIFMTYVNLRFGAAFVFDYVLPIPYVLLTVSVISQLTSAQLPITMLVAAILCLTLLIGQLLRTDQLGKLGLLRERFYGLN